MMIWKSKLCVFLLSILISIPFLGNAQINKDSLVQVMESTKEDSVKVKLLTKLAYLYSLSDLIKSYEFANNAIEISKKSHLKKELLEAYKAAGKICFDMGLMEDAAKYFNLCLELIYQKGNKLEMAMANLNVGAMFLYMGDNKKAEDYHLKSLQLLKEDASSKKEKSLNPFVINIYNNLGLIYKKLLNVPKALYYNELGINLAENNPDYAQTYVFLLHNQGELFIEQKKFKEADTALNKAIDISEKLNFVGGLTPSYKLLGEINKQQGNNEAALSNYRLGYKFAVASNNNDLIQSISNKLQLIYKDLGNTDSSFKYLNISIDAQNKIKLIQAHEELMNKENKRKFEEWQKESEKKQQTFKLLYLTIAIVFLLLGFVLFTIYLRKRKLHKLILLEKIEKDLKIQHLELEKKLLETSLEDKEKQLANDVLYQIQKNEIIEEVVSKLLHQTKQATGINKEVVKEAIKDLGRTTEENVWSEFEIRFKQVHVNFYDNLQLKFPELTRNERRLCAFLRLNMSSKEISAISGQSPKTIDVARSRLRKKLGIVSDEISLIAFLSDI